ncbi:mitochondrial carrier protein, putative [Trypanosoma brucei gambiense DAL972]|uniref:Mitochondrial carrier protein, putative n=1 Tax=Trypanosoma brucei gambiense (strain MHOM/CI/86/DAL972) TaxID=679716 RepID=D0A9N0_TRYB9|nr:mitochondrial carrier protein, putative [Trypanosoma brucei gambiense DAL972]CBH18381.1 mitochondrial carrier protein, putative [Trypanosoma brucei gambiense DAL972]|eukprot:XP_011780645.1 mitochondrial carrier protein, putative [Trypanosoma brucei gambiense DAL972]
MIDWALTFLPGAAQGMTTVVLGQPLDSAKTRAQACGPLAARSAWKTMLDVAREEGVRSLYRGTGPPLIMSATKRSLQYALWDSIRAERSCNKPPRATHSTPMASHPFRSLHVNELLRSVASWLGESPFRSGACAGAAGTFIGCPFHVIKLRTQYSTRRSTRNAWVCAANIFRSEGIKGYFHGFGYHLLKDTCFAGCYLGFYDINRRWLRAWCTSSTGTESPGIEERLPTEWTFVAGCTASMVTWALLYPLDTVKTIVQARCVGTLAVVELLQRESPLVIYRGLGVSLLRAGPISGVSMVVYEYVKSRTDRWQKEWR